MDLRLTGIDLITLAPGGENENLHTTTSTDQRSLALWERKVLIDRDLASVLVCHDQPKWYYVQYVR